MERDSVERNAMVGAENDDALQALGRVEGAQRLGGDAAGIVDPGVGDDDHLGAERAGRSGGEVGVERRAQGRGIGGIEHPRHLGGMDGERSGRGGHFASKRGRSRLTEAAPIAHISTTGEGGSACASSIIIPARSPDGRILCDVCPRVCKIGPGQRGLCYVRQNVDGHMVLTTDGLSSGFCVDPIEKKPLNHFLPGSSVLSFGTAGCNLACAFCQNHEISKSREVDTSAQRARRRRSPARRSELGCASVAFTYNDPVIFYEYAIDVAEACRARGIKTVAVTAGSIKPGPRAEFFRAIDAANVDLKAFTDRFYWRRTASNLAPVLDTLKYLRRETDVWLEITTLLIPGENDSESEIDALTRWVVAGTRRRDAAAFFRLPPRLPHARPAADAEGDAAARARAGHGRTA